MDQDRMNIDQEEWTEKITDARAKTKTEDGGSHVASASNGWDARHLLGLEEEDGAAANEDIRDHQEGAGGFEP